MSKATNNQGDNIYMNTKTDRDLAFMTAVANLGPVCKFEFVRSGPVENTDLQAEVCFGRESFGAELFCSYK